MPVDVTMPEIVSQDGSATGAAERVASELRARIGTASSVIVVVGLGYLEIARPELPPLDAGTRHALVARDADRYFPLGSRVAVAVSDDFAFAADADVLAAWVAALRVVGPVGAVTTIVDCIARMHARMHARRHARTGAQDPDAPSADATYRVDGGAGETGVVRLTGGRVHDVRRVPHDEQPAAQGKEPDRAALAGAAQETRSAPLHTMLLDDTLLQRMASARRGRWARSAMLVSCAAAALVWAGDVRRERTLQAAERALQAIEARSAPARDAEARLTRARLERAALEASANDDDLAAVLDRLGRLLPTDAYVERLEWDGTVWRIDGSAANAPRIVPLLDADPAFTDVRIVAASTRFLDQGRQRESFSISFRAPRARRVSAAPATASADAPVRRP